jgi:CubicO group peptidase (beta-lactamase class C family)
MSFKTIVGRSYLALFLMLSGNCHAQYNFTNVDRVLDTNQKNLGRNICVLVSKNDKIIYSYVRGDYNETTPELIASCSKWFTAALVMTFADEGKLSVDDPVSKYLPEFTTADKKNILIRHCLSHTTGIESEPITLASLRDRRKYQNLGEEVSDFATKPMAGKPGSVFAYSSVGLNTAGHLLEVISGKDFETLFQERIARPLGMTSTTFVSKKAVNPSGGATSTALDYIKFLEMILHQGKYKGIQILSERSVAAMQESQTANARVLYTPEQAEGLEYGFGEWIHRKDAQGRGIVVSSPGLFGTFPYINRSGNYVAIVFVKNIRVKGRKETYGTILTAIENVLPPL